MPEISSGIASQVMFWLDEHYTHKFSLAGAGAEPE
jgi:hypothetical protein